MYYYDDLEEPESQFLGEYDDAAIMDKERKHMMEVNKELYQERVQHWKETKHKRDLRNSQKRAHKTLTASRKRRAEIMEMVEGGPFQHTIMVEEPGWYRLCVAPITR